MSRATSSSPHGRPPAAQPPPTSAAPAAPAAAHAMHLASRVIPRRSRAVRARAMAAALVAAPCAGPGLLLVLLHVTPAAATPFVPKADAEIVEKLPSRIASPNERREQRQMREQLRGDPQQLPLALQVARESIGRARTLGDPREYGQAQAALAAWWSLPNPPPPVRLMRAVVRQAQHEFGAALADLDALVAEPPAAAGRAAAAPVLLALRAQAELTRASVLQVTGRWADAAAGCERLGSARYATLGAAVRIPSQACLAELSSLRGQAAKAALALAALAREDAEQGGADAAWLALLRAELAERRGDGAAQGLFRQALQLQRDAMPERPPDVYTLAAYADWLLARGRNREVAELLAGREDADALLLRLAIAWKAGRDARAAAAIATLTARFDAAAQRGDLSHGREQSRYELELMDNPAAALRHARLNWASQREPGDALTLLRAARAAGDAPAAEPVWRMVRDTGWEDVRLAAVSNAAAAGAGSAGAGAGAGAAR